MGSHAEVYKMKWNRRVKFSAGYYRVKSFDTMWKISFCAIVCFCVANVLGMSEEMQEVIDMLHNTCKEETGVSEDLIKGAQNGNFADDQKLKCYSKCLMSEMATISDDGVIDVEATIALMPDDIRPKMEPTIRKCGSPVGADPCDNALLTFKCYYENNKENFFMP